MILVRTVFQTEWGKSTELAARMVEFEKTMRHEFGDGSRRIRILTDLSGPFHTIVQEIEVESLEEWERGLAKLFAHPKFQEFAAATGNMMVDGRREFYTIEN